MDKKIYYVCKYTPVELLKGMGFEPVPLDPVHADHSCAESCAHANLCGYGKGVLEEALTTGVSALILTDCCDVMRRVYDVLKAGENMRFLYFLSLPHLADSDSVKLFSHEIEKLYSDLSEDFDAKLDDEAFITAWNESSDSRAQAPDFHDAIILAGAHGNSELERAARTHFDAPVINLTCSGIRKLAPPTDERALAAYAEALLNQSGACMRMMKERDEERDGMLKVSRGVLFHTVKFCDYYSFEYRRIRRLLGKSDVSMLKFETDLTQGSAGQLSTRFEAFAESTGTNYSSDRRRKVMSNCNINRKLIAAGIDSGSTSTDAAIIDSDGNLLGWSIVKTGAGASDSAAKALKEALEMAGIEENDLCGVVSTGYGRENIGTGDRAVTEITCHARGARFLDKDVRTIIDIGGQDSKVIVLDDDGRVKNFAMNDKCAAGTGRFMEQMARVLSLSLDEMSLMGIDCREEITISSMCTVFAESEVVSLIAENKTAGDIVHGLCDAVANKTASLLSRAGGRPPYFMTGGVAKNKGVVEAIKRKLKSEVKVSENAQLAGAIGAALIAINE